MEPTILRYHSIITKLSVLYSSAYFVLNFANVPIVIPTINAYIVICTALFLLTVRIIREPKTLTIVADSTLPTMQPYKAELLFRGRLSFFRGTMAILYDLIRRKIIVCRRMPDDNPNIKTIYGQKHEAVWYDLVHPEDPTLTETERFFITTAFKNLMSIRADGTSHPTKGVDDTRRELNELTTIAKKESGFFTHLTPQIPLWYSVRFTLYAISLVAFPDYVLGIFLSILLMETCKRFVFTHRQELTREGLVAFQNLINFSRYVWTAEVLRNRYFGKRIDPCAEEITSEMIFYTLCERKLFWMLDYLHIGRKLHD